MMQPAAKPNGSLALDTDWMTAAFAGFCFVFCLLAVAATSWRVLTGAPVKAHITRETVFLLLASVWLAARVRERPVRFVCGLWSISLASRIVLAIFHASVETQATNEQVMRVVDLPIMVGFCVYIAYWFKDRLKRVHDIHLEEGTKQLH